MSKIKIKLVHSYVSGIGVCDWIADPIKEDPTRFSKGRPLDIELPTRCESRASCEARTRWFSSDRVKSVLGFRNRVPKTGAILQCTRASCQKWESQRSSSTIIKAGTLPALTEIYEERTQLRETCLPSPCSSLGSIRRFADVI